MKMILKKMDNPLDELRVGSTETMLISTISYSIEEENVIIAPGEKQKAIINVNGSILRKVCFALPAAQRTFSDIMLKEIPI